MAKKQQEIVTVKSLPGQILQHSDEELTENGFDIFKGGSGKFYKDISARTVHTTIDDIRAMGANGIPDANPNIQYLTKDFDCPGFWNVNQSDATAEDDGSTIVITAGGTILKRCWPSIINASDFGINPDGVLVETEDGDGNIITYSTGTDNGPAFNKLFDFMDNMTLYYKSSSPHSYFFTSPIVYVPSGIYNIKTNIVCNNRSLRIMGHNAIIKADENFNQESFLMDTNRIEDMIIYGITIDGFHKSLNIVNSNRAGRMELNGVTLNSAFDAGVSLSCRSSVIVLNRCTIRQSKILINTCNKVILNDCSISPVMNKPTGNYEVEITGIDPQYDSTSCELSFSNCFMIPKKAVDFYNCAWVMNRAIGSNILFNKCRISGEDLGIPAVINDADGTQSFGHQSSIIIDGCEVYGRRDGGRVGSAPIILKKVPNLISIKNNTGFFRQMGIMWHPDVQDPKSVVNNITDSTLIDVSGNVIRDVSKDSASYAEIINKFIPIELHPFLSDNAKLVVNKFTGTDIDMRYSYNNMSVNINEDTVFEITNPIPGKRITVFIENSSINSVLVTIQNGDFGSGVNDFRVPAGGSKGIAILNINNKFLCSSLSVEDDIIRYFNFLGGVSIKNEYKNGRVYSGFKKGFLIKTSIPTANNIMFNLNAYGNTYTRLDSLPESIIIKGYKTINDSYESVNAIMFNEWNSLEMKVFNINGFTCFYIESPDETTSLYFTLNAGYATHTDSYKILSVSDEEMPVGITNELDINKCVIANKKWVNEKISETAIKSITDDYQMTNDDYTILVDTVTKGADINVTLPASPADKQKARVVNFLQTGTGHQAILKDGATTLISIDFKGVVEMQYFDGAWRAILNGTT